MEKSHAQPALARRIQMIMGLLSLQFILGMGLNTVGEPDSAAGGGHKALWDALLALHIINGLVLLAVAAYILFSSYKNRAHLEKPALISTVSITLAAIFGLLTLSHVHEELFSFLMALSFLVAIGTYGQALVKIGGRR